MHSCEVWNDDAHLNHIANKIRQNFVLFDLLPVIADLLLHDTLLMLQPQRLGPHDLSIPPANKLQL